VFGLIPRPAALWLVFAPVALRWGFDGLSRRPDASAKIILAKGLKPTNWPTTIGCGAARFTRPSAPHRTPARTGVLPVWATRW